MSNHQIHEKNLLQAVINAVPAPIFFKDREGRYLGGNEAFESYIGIPLDQLVGHTVHELFEKELADVYQQADDALMDEGGAQVYEAKVKYADGSLRDVEFHKAVFHADIENIRGIVGVILDVTDRNEAQRQYQRLAFTDALTGLNNRLAFQHDLKHALLRAQRTESTLALMLLDLDGFKQINDTYGHPAGDSFLTQIAGRLQEAVRKSDIIARIGGDEFAVVLEDINDFRDVQSVAENILLASSEPIGCCGVNISISTSIGVSLYTGDDHTIDELISEADTALYQSKKAGKNTMRWFDLEGGNQRAWENQSLI